MSTTLKDIAERAQVSQATVSIAMGSTGRISEKTRERVLRIADELGYRPNLLVQGIQKGQTMTVGVLMHFVDFAFDVGIFNGIHDTLAKANYVPIVLRPTEVSPVLEQVHSLIDRRVDGILLRPASEAYWEKHLSEALDRKVPVVAMDVEPQAEMPQIDFVGTDNVLGSRLAAEALLEAGHRRLGIVSTGTSADALHERSETFKACVEQCPGAEVTTVVQPWEVGIEGYPPAQELLAREPRPTAIFSTMDALAVGVYRVAREMGLRIPEDLSVVGFADNPVAHTLNPPLSTLSQQPEEIGAQAAELLLERIREGEVHSERKRVLFEPQWCPRGSIAAPASAS